jgi:V8-like Glu-specific endopeptidase
MNAVVAPVTDLASFLADWTELPDGRFARCYIDVRVQTALPWESIVASASGEPILLACREAQAHGFLEELAKSVGTREDLGGRRPIAQIREMLETVRGYGLMQGLTDAVKGLMGEGVLDSVEIVREACAVVFNKKTLDRFGTAFLVAPDLVLTAAHVVLEPQNGDWGNTLRNDLAFRFKSRNRQGKSSFVEVLAAANNPLVRSGLPHGLPPNKLDLSLGAKAGARLDFALVRLAQRVEHVEAVDITGGGVAEIGRPCWALGFPKGDALNFDVDVVTHVDTDAGRWLHKANTAAGMSGGCCVNHDGYVAGVHEGTLEIPQDGQVVQRNRGVSIEAILAAITSGGSNPLKERSSTPGLELQDASAVTELYRTGARLSGAGRAAPWRQLLSEVLGKDPDTEADLPPFHPWFPQPDAEAWIDKTDPDAKLALIWGNAGVGKSFCARILREKLGPRVVDLFEFSPTQLTAFSWPDAIGPIVATERSDHRTDAASIRYRDFQDVIREVERRAGVGGRTSYVVMDFGPPGETQHFDGTQWMELIAVLLAAEGVRLMIIGLEEFDRTNLIDRLYARPETKPVAQAFADIEIRHLKQNKFREYLQALAKARGTELPANLDQMVEGVYRAGQLGDTQTVMAALAAIRFEASLP